MLQLFKFYFDRLASNKTAYVLICLLGGCYDTASFNDAREIMLFYVKLGILLNQRLNRYYVKMDEKRYPVLPALQEPTREIPTS